MNFDYLILLNIVQIIILIGLGLSTLYIFLFSLFGLFYRQPRYPKVTRIRKIAVLIPGYKEDEVIVEVASEALNQNYPGEFFDVIIIADSFLPETIEQLKKLPIKIIKVSFEKSTKSKALNKAMEELDNSYEIAVILDADNVMALDFLTKVNAAFEQNCIALQGHRTAKNINTSLAILDAVSEEINNHIFRKGHRVIGLSSAIIGSGMAFKYDFFKNLMLTVHAVGGFDKEIELKLLKAGHTIFYLDDAIIYDEKVQKAEVFSNQRRRWLSAQLHYFRLSFLSATKDLFLKGNVDYFDKAIQFIQPPRILLLGEVIVLGFTFLAVNRALENYLIYSIIWVILGATCVLSFLFSVPRSYYNFSTIRASLSLPKGMFMMLLSLLKIRGANTIFIHTKHNASSK